MRNYFSPSNMAAGIVAVMVGFSSSAVIVFQAATLAGANTAEISSWLFALGVSISFSCIGLSLYYRMPILVGWSTPGAAILVSSLSGFSMPEAIGAFMFAAALTIISGVTGFFARIINYIPRSLISAMLAGILLNFGLNVFTSLQNQFTLVFTMLITYLIGKRFFPRYVIIIVLITGISIAKLSGLFHLEQLHLAFASPIFTVPKFSLSAFISVGIPLFIVTMTSQNIPGIAVLNAAGYRPPISPLISWTGFSTLMLAPFGCYSVCLAAITAAICSGEEADLNPSARYKATIFAGICWFVIGILGATVVALFAAFPKELILSIAGLALFTTISSCLKVALEAEAHREPAIITILVSASGLSLLGIGAAFWGLIAGILSSILLNWRQKETYSITVTTR